MPTSLLKSGYEVCELNNPFNPKATICIFLGFYPPCLLIYLSYALTYVLKTSVHKPSRKAGLSLTITLHSVHLSGFSWLEKEGGRSKGKKIKGKEGDREGREERKKKKCFVFLNIKVKTFTQIIKIWLMSLHQN